MDRLLSWFLSGQINVLSFVISAFFMGVVAMLWSQRGKLHCVDLITDKTGKISRPAIAECAGIIICIFTPVWQTVQGKIDSDILGICLGLLFSSAGWGKWLRYKQDVHVAAKEMTP